MHDVKNVKAVSFVDFRYLATTNLMGDQGSDHVARIARFSLDAVRIASVRLRLIIILCLFFCVVCLDQTVQRDEEIFVLCSQKSKITNS